MATCGKVLEEEDPLEIPQTLWLRDVCQIQDHLLHNKHTECLPHDDLHFRSSCVLI